MKVDVRANLEDSVDRPWSTELDRDPAPCRKPHMSQLQESHQTFLFQFRTIPGFLDSISMHFLGLKTLFSTILISFKPY